LLFYSIYYYYYYSLAESQIHFVKESSSCFYWGLVALVLRVVHEGAPECNFALCLCVQIESRWNRCELSSGSPVVIIIISISIIMP